VSRDEQRNRQDKPRIAGAPDSFLRKQPAAASIRSWQILLVVAILIGGVALGGWLLGRSATPAPTSGVAQTTQLDNLRVTVQLDQATTDSRTVDVAVRDANGQPQDVSSVRLRFYRSDADVGSMEANAERMQAGQFRAGGPFFTSPGRWGVDVLLYRDGQSTIQTSFIFPITIGLAGASSVPVAASSGTAQVGIPQPAEAFVPQPSAGQGVLVPDVEEILPRLVFTRQGNVWSSDGTGAPPKQLTTFDSSSYAEHPSFSSDSSRIAFVVVTQPPITATVPLPTSTLYVMNADGSNMRELWKPGEALLGMPRWSPDGKALYLALNGSQPAPDGNGSTRLLQILRFDLETGERQPILNDALDPAISNDGAQIAYLQLVEDGYTMALDVAAPDGRGARTVLDDISFQGFYAPRFSPDGKRIVVAAIGGPETDEQGYPIKTSSQAPSLIDQALALFEPPAAEAHGLPWDLWEVNVDGSGLRRLTKFYEDLPMTAFSPDGSQIAIMGYGGIYLMAPDGSKLRRIDRTGDHGGIDWARGQ
jgi:Tol biopolymer transport system component